ncbi:unnamed protein product [Malus baccata var. baccata]
MAAAASSPSSSPVRWWRTAFLTVRDKTLTTPLRTPIPELLHHSIFSHSHTLLSALVTAKPHSGEDLTPTFTHITHLIHDISHRIPVVINSASWTLLLDFFNKMLRYFIGSSSFTPVMEALQTLRRVMSTYQRKRSMAEEVLLVKFLMRIIESSHAELSCFSNSILNQSSVLEVGKRMPVPRYGSLWEIQTLAFTMVGEAISRVGSYFPLDIWRPTIEVFQQSLLCLLRHIINEFHTCSVIGQKEKEPSLASLKLGLEDSKKTNCTPYRPPHLRQGDNSNMKQSEARGSQSLSDHESSVNEFALSDSDYGDSDGSIKDTDNIQKSKVPVAAIVCIQDLCQADSKSFSSQWTLLLPTSDVLRPRKYEATLMTCLLFDPYLKARVASASTLEAMLDGPSSVFLQVAEFKESSKRGSFKALSSSLGHILMQLHTGILYLIQCETHSRLMASLLKILMLLRSSTPYVYSRMPGELLPTVFTSLQERMKNGFTFKSDHTVLLASSISCLTTALNISPSSPQVKEMVLVEISNDFVEATKKSGVLSMLFRFSEQVSNPTISTHEVPTGSWKGNTGNFVGFIGEKVITATIKVLDECLRAISGFKGTEDPLDDKLLDAPFISDCVRMKKVSSAPLYEPENSENTLDEPTSCQSGTEQWCEAIEKHMPLILHHTSSVVRAASVTCFAGITSSVYFSFSKEKQDFILSSCVRAAVNDVPSVRSAACRALGVISMFPQILDEFVHAVEINTRDPWSRYFSIYLVLGYPEISKLFILLTECALRLTKDGDKVKSNAVRALGNLSRSIKYRSGSTGHTKPYKIPSRNYREGSQRDVSMSCHPASLGDSCWLEQVTQALISCVTTGNVKVQWNVCHALSNLFLNETLRLQDMDWASSVCSILLLLLRDSSNFKIRIQAASTLAVPASILDYGESFSNVIQGLVHILENQGSDRIASPSNFKYRVALENQLTSTVLHVLILTSSSDHEPVKDFLVKKASFLEDWFKALCLSLGETTSSQAELEDNKSIWNPKKEIGTLIQLYNSRKHHAIEQKFEKLANSIP